MNVICSWHAIADLALNNNRSLTHLEFIAFLYNICLYCYVSVYVLLGDLNAVVDLITNLYDRGLLDTGEYIVIYVDLGTFDITYPLKYFKRKYLVQK